MMEAELTNGERILTIGLAFFTQTQCVTDRRTEFLSHYCALHSWMSLLSNVRQRRNIYRSRLLVHIFAISGVCATG